VEQGNPFRYGAPVSDVCFCDRDEELAALVARMRDGIHAIVLSPRRYGKTSLLKAALHTFRAQGGRGGYADLILCSTEYEVAAEVLSAVVNGVLRGPKRAGHSLEAVVRRLRVRPTVSVGQTGEVAFGVETSVGRQQWRDVLDDALDLLDSASERRPSALVLDEFQQVASVGTSGMGGVFKAAADRLDHTSLVFSGSHLSVMEKLTKARGAPLHGMGDLITLDVVPPPEMVRYLVRRARSGGKRLSRADALTLFERAGGIPNDVQWLAHAAFEAAAGGEEIDGAAIDAGLAAIVGRQAAGFAERVGSLAPSQQRVLKALAAAPTRQVYARAFLDAVDVANTNAVTKALRSLEERELVRRRAGVFEVASPFLVAWLNQPRSGG